MSFVAYDLTFLVLFTLFVIIFLYTRKHNLKRQGLLYLYHTSWGLKLIEKTSKRFEKILKPMQYVVVASGYLLMVFMIWMLLRITYIYSTSRAVVEQIKIPPVIPLVPYLPEIFKVDFLPPFYFTYWIIIIAIVAISHEFAHGIFARLNKIKVHSTGFGFLGPFLAAFVEPDEKQMRKAKKFPQLSILAAGTFANVIMTILFGLIFWLFFAVSFAPAGVNFNDYGKSYVNVDDIVSINGINLNSVESLELNNSLARIQTQNNSYLAPGSNIQTAFDKKTTTIIVYDDAPAINARLRGPIVSIDGNPIRSMQDLRDNLATHSPGDIIQITTLNDSVEVTQQIKLDEKDGKPYLGIGFVVPQQGKLASFFYSLRSKINDPFVYYEPQWGGDFSWFIYNLLWWTVLINISVALMNMLPVGIFDGGRFFYLTVWGITGKEKLARGAFAFMTWLIIAILVWLMVRWAAVIL